VKEVDNVICQFLRQVHFGWAGGTGQPWKRSDHLYRENRSYALSNFRLPYSCLQFDTLGPYSVENGLSK
jgi:hypothetical protein